MTGERRAAFRAKTQLDRPLGVVGAPGSGAGIRMFAFGNGHGVLIPGEAKTTDPLAGQRFL